MFTTYFYQKQLLNNISEPTVTRNLVGYSVENSVQQIHNLIINIKPVYCLNKCEAENCNRNNASNYLENYDYYTHTYSSLPALGIVEIE